LQPNREDERARIEAAGGRVIHWKGYRVLGVLAMSRSIGMYLLHHLYNMIGFLATLYHAVERKELSNGSAIIFSVIHLF